MYYIPVTNTQKNIARRISYIAQCLLCVSFFVIFVSPSFAQNACSEAIDLGGITTIPNCITGTNENATVEEVIFPLKNCQEGLDMPTYTASVWYKFYTEGELLDIEITNHNFKQLSVAVYSAVDCNLKIGRDCRVTNEPVLQIDKLATGITDLIYIQISGENEQDLSAFDMCLTSYLIENNTCIGRQKLGVSPSTVYNGYYSPGETIEFCLRIEDYFLGGFDWLHGIVPVLGAGWDLSTLKATPPTSCDGQGQWNWYEEVRSANPLNAEATGTQGPGFFYDSINGTPDGATELDGDPGNNYGDNPDGNACNWEFCIEVSTKTDCTPTNNGQDLSVNFLNFADSETGSTTSSSECFADPSLQIKPVLACCEPPTIRAVSPICDDPASGKVIVVASGEPPFTFSWSSSNMTETSADKSTLLNLTEGYYEVTVTDGNGCRQVAGTSVKAVSLKLKLIEKEDSRCFQNTGSILVDADGGQAPYRYKINNQSFQATSKFTELAPRDYTIQVRDGTGCIISQEITIEELGNMTATIIEEQPDCVTGTTTGSIYVTNASGIPPLIYALNGGEAQTDSIFANLSPATYEVQVSDAVGCSYQETISIQADPSPIVTVMEDQTIELGDSIQLIATIEQGTVTSYQWTPSNGVACSTCLNTIVSPTQTTQYTLKVFNEKGCAATDQVTVFVTETNPIFNTPTAFSPNNDGINDSFSPLIQNVQYIASYELHIFDRWGNPIFETTDPLNGWDGLIEGEIAPLGTYVYWYKYTNREGESELEKGNILLMR